MNDVNVTSPRPNKDCRICNRRRIKCDRSTPSCTKCTSRNLVCSGYGIKLNWEWGVASRGKLARKSIPLLSSSISSSSQSWDEAVNEDHDDSVDNDKMEPALSPEIVSNQIDRLQLIQTSRQSSNDNMTQLITLCLCPGINSLLASGSIFLQESTSRRLFNHYEETIAATMVWVDSGSNPWRSVMIPMALQSDSLLNSILALAAEHLSVILPNGEKNLARRSQLHRDKALQLLAADMSSSAIASETASLSYATISHRNTVINSVLASMLMLCNMETVRPESKLWRLHLDAARIVVGLRANLSSVDDQTFTFLVQQFFITDAFACTTSFAQIDHEELLTEDSGSIFIEILRLVRRVTAIERKAAAGEWLDPEHAISPSLLRNLFQQARDRTLVLTENTQFPTLAERGQFIRVVESFYHAGLLYSYRCLSYPDQAEEFCKIRLELFRNLDLLPSDHSGFAQNVMWPLFIAGTEARSDDGTRVLVERKLQQAMKRTGFSNCQEALAFLRALWITRDGGQSVLNTSENQGDCRELNWIHCARAWANMGNHFLVF